MPAMLHAARAARMIVSSRRAHRAANRGPQRVRARRAPRAPPPHSPLAPARRARLPRRPMLENPHAAHMSSMSPITAPRAKDEPSKNPRGRKFDDFV
ncbi:hypothetical protein [Burkholderia savannae]|uniref:hypothetical protein n=1 Tax=Burkholderia savannae TaxID=1637837 RepID=UPI0012E39DE8|nr:hypothetical protein [Burkholderia savannae]